VARALAGPLLIVIAVIVVLNGFVFRGLINTADVLSFWLPTYCFLGKSLAAGHIPAWNPFMMGGVPFAADPQSGWMYLPVMALFATLPCAVAIRALIVLQPILAGLGIYWFLRSEGLSRPSSTSGGLVLALGISGSNLVVSLPFAGTLAWTAVGLAACSRYLRAGSWPSRLLWGGLVAGAWGQLAAAHFSTGLIMGTGVLVAFVTSKTSSDVRTGRRTGRDASAFAGLLVLLLPAVNLAYLLPRIAYTPRTNLQLGYGTLQSYGALILGKPAPPFQIGASNGPGFILDFAAAPAAHLGAVILALAFAGWWVKRHRHLVVGLSIYGAIAYLLSLRLVAEHVPPSIRAWRPVDIYLRSPEWYAFELVPVIAVLGAVGLEAWREHRTPRERFWMLAPGVLLWIVLPFVLGANPAYFVILAAAAAIGGALLVLVLKRPSMAIAIPALLAVELTVNGLTGGPVLPYGPAPGLLAGLGNPTVSANDYVRTGAITKALQGSGERYLREGLLEPEERTPEVSVGILPDHGLLFGTENAGAYDPLSLLRYWTYVRVAQGKSFKYNRVVFSRPVPGPMLDLLQIGFIISSEGPPQPGAVPVAQQGAWVIYKLPDVPPRASVVTAWEVRPPVTGPYGDAFPSASLAAVTAPGFDPSAEVILERDPGLASSLEGTPGTPSYQALGDQAARVEVSTPVPAVLLVRNVFDRGWHASLDGKPVPVLRADYLMQGIAVPPGAHLILLTYDDPAIGWGLLGSGLGVALLLCAALALSRRRDRGGEAESDEPVAAR
jgi:hypothetical protein